MGSIPASQRIKNSILTRSPLMSKKHDNEEAKSFKILANNLSSLDTNKNEGIKFFNI